MARLSAGAPWNPPDRRAVQRIARVDSTRPPLDAAFDRDEPRAAQRIAHSMRSDHTTMATTPFGIQRGAHSRYARVPHLGTLRSTMMRSLRPTLSVLCTVTLALAFAPAVRAQGPTGDPTMPPTGLRVAVVDVGQGSATIVVGPTGTAMVVDGGSDGNGRNKVIPMLVKLGVTQVAYTIATHYDADHIGGLDEVLDYFPVLSAWDRGPQNAPSNSFYSSYVRAAGTKRATVAVGTKFNLGGGATATVLAADGVVAGVGSFPIQNAYQYENAASIVLKVEYGDFDMWLGGDLTGGGLSTYDMESKVAPVCGDVDVLLLDHHGSNTSTNTALMAALRPEVCVGSAGANNSYGHPTTGTINRVNTVSDSRLMLCTTPGSSSYQGFATTGTVTFTTDGYRYRVESTVGGSFDVYTDEVPSSAVSAGALRISELHRNPTASQGTYLEIYCKGPEAVNLRGLQVSCNSGSFTISTPYRLLPGDYLLLQQQGDPALNRGLPAAHCWPYQAFSPGVTADTITLRLGFTVLDQLSYSGNLAGGSGVAAERAVLDIPTAAVGFLAATTTYGGGDRGTPGRVNSVDATRYAPTTGIEVLTSQSPGGRALHILTTAYDHTLMRHVFAMSLGSSPGMTIAGTHIPLNPDLLFQASLLLPGVSGTLPGSGRRGIRIPVPLVQGLQGLGAYGAHVILDPTGPVPFPAASNAVRFVFP